MELYFVFFIPEDVKDYVTGLLLLFSFSGDSTVQVTIAIEHCTRLVHDHVKCHSHLSIIPNKAGISACGLYCAVRLLPVCSKKLLNVVMPVGRYPCYIPDTQCWQQNKSNKHFPPPVAYSVEEDFRYCFGIISPYDQPPEDTSPILLQLL